MYLSKIPLDITVVYYTCNYLEKENPVFVKNTKEQLIKAIGDHPLVSVSHEPMDFGHNVCVGDIGRSHFNIYYQMLEGCKAAKTEYIALAEDDIFYSYDHFHTYVPKRKDFAYDMQKLSIFTWTKPPMYSFRTKRRVVNQLIARRTAMIEALEERFERRKVLHKEGWDDARISSKWGDIGRYENLLGVTVREAEEFHCGTPSIVFTHPKAYGYETNHGSKKRLGDIRMFDIPEWGKASDMVRYYYE
jgi:hypothetical protein